MKIFDKRCTGCKAVYKVAESESLVGEPGQFACVICGSRLDVWHEPRAKVFRLVVDAQRREFRLPAIARELN